MTDPAADRPMTTTEREQLADDQMAEVRSLARTLVAVSSRLADILGVTDNKQETPERDRT